MKFKSKRHLILSMKKKSGVALSDAEVKELLGIEGTTETEVKETETKETPSSLSNEDIAATLASLTENVNMLMEAVATLMENQPATSTEEVKETEVVENDEDEIEETEEKELSDEELEAELEKTIAELEKLA